MSVNPVLRIRARTQDALHELRIWWAKELAMASSQPGDASKAWRRHAELISVRSPEQVARMERRMGITGSAKN